MAYVQVGTQNLQCVGGQHLYHYGHIRCPSGDVAFGLGAVTPAVTSGIITPSGTFNAQTMPPVTMNGARVAPASAVLAPGTLGVYIVTVVVPSGVSGPITVVLGGQERLLQFRASLSTPPPATCMWPTITPTMSRCMTVAACSSSSSAQQVRVEGNFATPRESPFTSMETFMFATPAMIASSV